MIPVNNTAENTLIIIILVYSAIKISAKDPLLYSVLNPETNSDSPSAKSNGVRFVSAKTVVNHIRDRGNSMINGHAIWFKKIWVKLNDVKTKRNLKRISAILISYEIVWAILRKAPSRAYLELEDHPAPSVE